MVFTVFLNLYKIWRDINRAFSNFLGNWRWTLIVLHILQCDPRMCCSADGTSIFANTLNASGALKDLINDVLTTQRITLARTWACLTCHATFDSLKSYDCHTTWSNHKALMHRGMVPLKTGPNTCFDGVKYTRKVSQLVCQAIPLDAHDFEYVHATGMLQDWVGKLVLVIGDDQAFVVIERERAWCNIGWGLRVTW